MLIAHRLNARPSAWLASLLAALLVAGCGGGGGGSSDGGTSSAQSGNGASDTTTAPVVETGAPQATGNMATDGFNWFNFRRQQMGLAAVTRNTQIDTAALNHSNYQAQNNTITHDETSSRRGFTGASVLDRLRAAQYSVPASNYAYGEVISSTPDTSGVNAAEDLIAAIYHRFVIFEPKFLEAGASSATAGSGYTYFTTDFATRTLNRGGLGTGKLVVYPFSNQQNLPVVFYSDQEQPDPVPDRNEVGYPVSVHVDITSTLTVQSFTINPRGGAVLATRLLKKETDTEIGEPSVAAIIPLSVLQPQTTYDVRFAGSVDNVPVNLAWSFTTR
ncbi:MAG: hypothetical protein JWM30_2175 [Burkholderia sp.]|nr:hypothetical protein [Burkholderia sp.]